jgi:mRNA-decapping enzyme subunit 2
MQHSNEVEEILSKWRVFKHHVPTNGAIILDETMRYVLLVQGFWAKASWGFPKGKIVEEESEAKCAIREVLEETGYDISQQLVEEQHLQININDQIIRLYIITNVNKNTKFEPKTRREIKEVRWFAIDELPVHRKDNRTKQTLGYSPNSFFMVIPFVKYYC